MRIRRDTPIAIVLLLAWIGAVLGGGCAGRRGPPPEPPRTPEWYASNVPLIAAYLQTLPDAAAGQVLDGIPLSDGQRWFAGVTYLGEPDDLPEGLHVRLLDDGQSVRAYMWLDEGGEPYELESCGTGPFRGIRAIRIGGAPYAWKALRPEHGVVYSPCPPASWLPADRPSAPSESGA